jgi:hypothetical protein
MSQKNLLEYFNQPLSVEDSPANRSVVPENKRAKEMIVISGQKCCGLSESLNRDGLWERMSQELLKSLSMTSSIALKRKDTPRKHTVIQFRLSERVIGGNESLSLPTITKSDSTMGNLNGKEFTGKNRHAMKIGNALAMLPTPQARESGRTPDFYTKGNNRVKSGTSDFGMGLAQKIAMLPTITTQEVEHPEMEISETGRRINKNWKDSHSIGLADRITMLRTPGTKDPGISPTRLQTKMGEPAKIGERAYDKQTGRLAQVGLTQQIAMLPTCTSRDYKDTGNMENVPVNALLGRELGKNHGLKLQPAFAEWMMGFPEGWTALSASEMPLSRSKSIRSSKRLQTLKGVNEE